MGKESKLLLRCVEFFSGIGGLHYALQETGIEYEMVAAYDINTVANTVYAHNFGLHPTSVNLEHLSQGHFESQDAACWLLSPPCQPYTRGGKMLDDEDLRAIGLLHLIKVLANMKNPPQFIFLENVLNFETSRSRDRLVRALAERGYQYEEFLLTPNDPWVGIPNDRLRYYLAARRVSEKALPIPPQRIIKKFSEILGPVPGTHGDLRPIRDYLQPEEGANPKYSVAEKYITDYKNYRHDIANPNGTRSTTFTKAYGSKYIIGTGSFLQTKRLDLQFEPDDQPTLLTLGLRFFTPTEIARLHAFPSNSSNYSSKQDQDQLENRPSKYQFEFPPEITTAQQYRLLGNSLNVRVVSLILGHLLRSSSGHDGDDNTNTTTNNSTNNNEDDDGHGDCAP